MLNVHQIIGRLGKSPEMRYMPSGEAVANFSVATTERWTDKTTHEKREETQWHRCTAFGKLAEVIGKWLTSGSLTYISGKSKTRKWTDQAGIERYSTEIVVEEMKMLSPKPQTDGDAGARQPQRGAPGAAPAARQAPAQRPASGFDDMDDMDIPF